MVFKWIRKMVAMFAAYRKGVSSVSVNRQADSEVGSKSLTRAYDRIFEAKGRGLPVAFLRALASKESSLKPDSELRKGINLETRVRDDTGKRDSYWGLFQVGISNVLKGYNKAHGTNIKREQLFDAPLNTAIAAWQIENQIIEAYAKFAVKHGIPELLPNWNSIEWVKMVVAGWNSGHSRSGGVQGGALWLKSKGLPVTHDNLYKYGKALYKGKVRSMPYINARYTKSKKDGGKGNKRGWQRGVAKRYFREASKDNHGIGPGPGPAGPLIAAGLFGLGLLVVKSVG